ncbi:MAG: family 78 glycoside hydrolase catalytic domain [Bacteroidaceae bacterium]|nr:family 78 glycoside hydrolase catalytic domain [Bacteroidaceae bacterium]
MMRLIASMLLLWLACHAGAFEIRETSCEQMPEPIGVDCRQLRFSWKVTSKERNYRQQAYQIEVSESANGRVVWDSGRMESEESVLVPYGGEALKPASTYIFRVRAWNTEGKVSKWSAPRRFITGLPDKADWQGARWIAMEEDRERVVPGYHGLGSASNALGDRAVGDYKLPQFRRAFTTKGKPVRATAFVCGLGHFDFFLNGQRIGNHLLDPGWTLYSKEALYVGFDVTSYMAKGENVAAIMLGNGFYNVPYDRERYFKLLTTFGAPKVMVMLRLEYRDGTVENIVSDDTWRVAESPITFSSIYGGEDYDARRERALEGWKDKGYVEDSRWQKARTVECDIALKPQLCHPLTVRETLKGTRIFRAANGHWVYDLGQNFSGIPRFTVRSRGSQRIILRPAELLNPDSTVNQSASGAPYYLSYTTPDGETVTTWQPQFTYYGFRYVQVEGAAPLGKGNGNEPEIEQLEGLHLCNAAPEVGSFRCDNELFNRIHRLIDWAIRSNMVSVLTDCPHREKLGWLEQTHLMQPSVQFRYDVASLYHKIFDDMATSQRADGCIPSITPEYVRFADGFEDSPEWGSTYIISAWTYYLTYGDPSLIVRHYEGMKRYAAYLYSRADNGIVDYGLGDWFDIGPASPGRSQLTSTALTATTYLYINLRMMKQMAHLVDQPRDEARFALQAATVKAAFNSRFINPETHLIEQGSQTACALPLFADILNEEEKAAAMQQLVADIRKRGNALSAGDIGYRYVLKELADGGHSDVIFDMNSRSDVPGYGWQLAHGATALTESWQAYGFISNNHFMLGHLMEWLYAYLGGIRQTDTSVGYKELLFDPQMVGDVNEAETSYETPYGRVACQWKRDKHRLQMQVTIPENSTAQVVMPTAERNRIHIDGEPLSDDHPISDRTNGHILQLGSGTYTILIEPAAP